MTPSPRDMQGWIPRRGPTVGGELPGCQAGQKWGGRCGRVCSSTGAQEGLTRKETGFLRQVGADV